MPSTCIIDKVTMDNIVNIEGGGKFQLSSQGEVPPLQQQEISSDRRRITKRGGISSMQFMPEKLHEAESPTEVLDPLSKGEFGKQATASNQELEQEYLDAKLRINSRFQSLRVQDPENIFKSHTRVLQNDEVEAFYKDLNTAAKGFLLDDHLIGTIALFKKISKFQNLYGKNEVNSTIEQKSLDIIADNLDHLQNALQTDNVEVQWRVLDLISLLAESDKKEVAHSGVAAILNNQEMLSSLLREPRQRINLRNVIKSSFASGDFDQQIAMRNIVEDAMMDGTDRNCAGFMADLLTAESPTARTYAEQIIADVLNRKYNIDGWAYMPIWRHIGNTRTKLSYIVNSNILTIDAIEKNHRGYSKILYDEFGIVNPGGYSVSRLIRQVENKDIIYDENNIVVYPYSDYNGAFRQDWAILDEFAGDLDILANERGESVELRIYEYGDLKRLDEILHGDNKYGEVKRAVVGGHGTPKSIDVGWESLTTSNLTTNIHPFANHPLIILVSCSTGQGKDTIANEFSKLRARVMAPDEDAALSMIRTERKDETVNIRVGFYGAEVKIFENGQEIPQYME